MTQEKALEILRTRKNVFLTGEPGAGKTYTINQFTEWLDTTGLPYAVTASTGIAASHIDGSTIHSWSGIGIMKNLEKEDIDGIRFHKYHYARIIQARVLILDEVSMLDSVFIDDLDQVLRAVHKEKDKPFGGIQIVMVGDFFQLPPVSRDRQVKFAFEANVWNEADFQICYLTEQHRQAEPIFTDLLRAIRFGQTTNQHREILQGRIAQGGSPVNLYTHNVDVDIENARKLSQLPGETKTYKMGEDGHPVPVATLKRNCLSPEVLELKLDAVVMFTSNNPKLGYVNGSIGVVTGFNQDGPVVKLLDGMTVYPERNQWKSYNEKKVCVATITQYPLRLAWAITVHKSQGMSLDSAQIDLSKAFEYGHGYVAISRVRSLEGLSLSGISDAAYQVNPKVIEQDLIFREKGV